MEKSVLLMDPGTTEAWRQDNGSSGHSAAVDRRHVAGGCRFWLSDWLEGQVRHGARATWPPCEILREFFARVLALLEPS